MKKIFVPVLMMVLSLILATKAAKAQTEVMCRKKAKEVAVVAFDDCMEDQKKVQAKARELQETYKSEAEQLKLKYDKMIKDLQNSGVSSTAIEPLKPLAPLSGPSKVVKTPTAPARSAALPKSLPAKKSVSSAKPLRVERPTKGVARALPKKMNDNGPALRMQQVAPENAVVAVENVGSDSGLDTGSFESSSVNETAVAQPESYPEYDTSLGDFE